MEFDRLNSDLYYCISIRQCNIAFRGISYQYSLPQFRFKYNSVCSFSQNVINNMLKACSRDEQIKWAKLGR